MVSVISSRQRKVNAPTFIYQIAYGKPPSSLIYGHVNHPSKMINNIPIDKGIPDTAIKQLNSIPEIEMRSSCQGESKDRPAFIVFRLNNDIDPQKLVSILNKNKDFKAGYDTGNHGKIRIGITNPNIYYNMDNKSSYQEWWGILPMKLKMALKQA